MQQLTLLRTNKVRLKSKVYKEVKPREHVVMKVPKFGTLHIACGGGRNNGEELSLSVDESVF